MHAGHWVRRECFNFKGCNIKSSVRIWPGKRKRSELIQSFDVRFNDPLMAFKAKYGHCDVPLTGENASLGSWCSELRVLYKKSQKENKPKKKLSDEQIQHERMQVSSGLYRLCQRMVQESY